MLPRLGQPRIQLHALSSQLLTVQSLAAVFPLDYSAQKRANVVNHGLNDNLSFANFCDKKTLVKKQHFVFFIGCFFFQKNEKKQNMFSFSRSLGRPNKFLIQKHYRQHQMVFHACNNHSICSRYESNSDYVHFS